MDRIEMVRDNFGKMRLSIEFWTSVSEISISLQLISLYS